MIDLPTSEIRFPEGFMCIGGMTFAWVFDNRKEFVEFTLEKMTKTSGLFLEWQNYCREQVKGNATENESTKSRQGSNKDQECAPICDESGR